MQASSIATSVIKKLAGVKEKQIGFQTQNDEDLLSTSSDSIISDKKTCQVCRDEKVSKYKIYGSTATVCNACRVFFSRAACYNLICKCEDGAKVINRYTRRDCKSCRFQNCLSAGMSLDKGKRKVSIVKENGNEDKRLRMVNVNTASGHAINQFKHVSEPIICFTFEEEFKVIDFIVRIEECQNRRIDFSTCLFPQYPSYIACMIKYKAEGVKIPYKSHMDNMLSNIGLESTKKICGNIFEEISFLTTGVQGEMLNSTYHALNVLTFCILEGNTHERTWVDQLLKCVHISKEYHQKFLACRKVRHLHHVPPLSLRDLERLTSPWAVTVEDEDRFERTVSRVGRLLRDDLHLQALYYMVVLLTPTYVNSPMVQQDETLLKVKNGVVQHLHRYLSTNPNINYRKTTDYHVFGGHGNVTHEERSDIMRMTSSEGLDELNAADKTELLLKLVEDIHECVDIMKNRSLTSY